MECFDQPIHSFVGHSDVVLDFGWHNKNGNEYELITWSKDNTLRVWKVDSALLTQPTSDDNMVPSFADFASDEINDNHSSTDSTECTTDSGAHKRPNTLELSNSETKPIAEPKKSVHSSHESDVKKPQTPETPVNNLIPNLTQEFSLINLSIPNIQIEELNASKRVCTITATTSISCRLKMTFPTGYPNHVAPRFEFSFMNGATAPSEEVKNELLKVLQTTAFHQVRRNRTCLEPCLRQFIDTLKRLTGSTTSTQPTLIDMLPSHHYGSYLDASVPFPRTSGARFCSGEVCLVSNTNDVVKCSIAIAFGLFRTSAPFGTNERSHRIHSALVERTLGIPVHSLPHVSVSPDLRPDSVHLFLLFRCLQTKAL